MSNELIPKSAPPKIKKRVMVPPPCGYNILIKVPEDTKLSTTIEILESTEAQRNGAVRIGDVVQMGEGAYSKAMLQHKCCSVPWCKVGDRVLFRQYASSVIPDTNNQYHLVTDEMIIANYSNPNAFEVEV